MTASWQPPSRMSHVRVFVLCILLLLAFLIFLLFAVHMEAVAPATGMIAARDLYEARTTLTGLIEPGWYEGELILPDGHAVPVRLDAQGNGMTDPALGPVREVTAYHVRDGGPRARVLFEGVRFHRLKPGDELWAGQVLAALRTDEWRQELELLDATVESMTPGMPPSPRRIRRDALRSQLNQAVLRVPESHPTWQAVAVHVAPLQSVAAGDLLAVLVPWDASAGKARDLVVRLKIDESHLADIAPGQTVRLVSNVYNQRLYGTGEAIIDRIEPWGEHSPDGRRRFTAVAHLREGTFTPPLGSTCRAEIVVGRKLVYRIILEH